MTVQQFIDKHTLLVTKNDGREDMEDSDYRWRDSILKGVRVALQHSEDNPGFANDDEQKRIIKEIGLPPTKQMMLDDGSANDVTVSAYYSAITTDPSALAALQSSDVAVKITTSDIDEEVWYPSGWLQIESPQPVHGILRGKQTENMIYTGQKKPGMNAQKITSDGLTMFGFNDNAIRQTLQTYGVAVGQKLIKIPARVLSTPVVLYNNGQIAAEANHAMWNLKQQAFAASAQLNRMAIADFGNNVQMHHHRNNCNNFGAVMKQVLQGHGMATDTFQTPAKGPYSFTKHTLPRDIDAALRRAIAGEHLDGLFVILPSDSDRLYSTIERIAEIDIGLKTVCVQRTKIQFMRPEGTESKHLQYASNVAMKCNLKGAGQNHHLGAGAFQKLFTHNWTESICNTIVLGADVAHTLKGASHGCPSVASVVGSIDDNFVEFLGSMRLQPGRQETIDKLKDMVKERLIDWVMKHEQRLPERILFYRDGVSESQYDAVRTKELPQLKEAYELAEAYLATIGLPDTHEKTLRYQRMAKDADEDGVVADKKSLEELEPPTVEAALNGMRSNPFQLTYVVVGKRHNTRFYPTNDDESFRTNEYDRTVNGNVKPGLCVDEVITNPYSFDFFLQSHLPIQGTGRAAHYFVLINQMGLSSDDLQQVVSLFQSSQMTHANNPSRLIPSAMFMQKLHVVSRTARCVLCRSLV